MPAYGRGVQSMVDYAVRLEGKEERQKCAEYIIDVMDKMFPQNRENADYRHKLWDHLAIMSGFKLDIDYPCDVSGARNMHAKPQSMGYPMTHIPVRHYGKLLAGVFEKLRTMPAGPERDELARITANQMKRDLRQWGHGADDDEKVAADMAQFTGGAIQIDLSTFMFERVPEKECADKKRRKR